MLLLLLLLRTFIHYYGLLLTDDMKFSLKVLPLQISSRCRFSRCLMFKKTFDLGSRQHQQFSLSSNQNLTRLGSNNEPIRLSSSPINNYKSSKTFNDSGGNIANVSTPKWPIIIGSTFLLCLTIAMIFGKEEPFDVFSTEVLHEFEEKINSTFQSEKHSSNGNVK